MKLINKSQEYSYTGIPTFFKSDYGRIDQLHQYQIGAFGVPIDTGVSNRFGARLGPSAIRKASTWYNPATFFDKGKAVDLYQNQKAIRIEHPSILDLGDVAVFPTDYKRTLKSIEHFAYAVAEHAFPIALGGDHSISYPVIKGIITRLQENKPFSSFGIIHFDAHPDIWESCVTLGSVCHGTPFRNLLEDGVIRGEHLVMVGDRALLGSEEYEFIKHNKICLYSMSDIWERGISAIMKEATEYLLDTVDGVYVSIDIDVFDPCYAPGTGTPLPGGLSSKEMIQAISIICDRLHLVGIDLVEVAPNYDPTESTQDLAAFLFHRFFIQYRSF
jgi:agmatinase